MECKVCMEYFNYSVHQPIALSCGHTCCKNCVKLILSGNNPICPFDRKAINKFKGLKINLALFNLIRKKAEPKLTNVNVLANEYINCPQGHLISNISELSGEDLETQFVCSYCRRSIGKNFKSCQPCRFVLCEDCAEDEINSTISKDSNIYCTSGHLVKFYSNTCLFYSRLDNKYLRVRCSLCMTVWTGASWACRLCEFDLCLNCLERIKKSNSCNCLNGHQLEISFDISQSFNCSMCKVNKKSLRALCNACNYELCEQCIDYENRNKDKVDVLCPSEHRLALSEDPYIMYYFMCRENSLSCSQCESLLSDEKVYHCRICFYQLCINCFNVEKSKTLDDIQEATPEYRVETFSNENFDENYYLDYFSLDLFKLVCEICNEPFDQNSFTPMLLNCGHSYCKQCLTIHSISTCPIDNLPIKSIKLNFAIQDLLESKQTSIKVSKPTNPTNLLCPNHHHLSYFLNSEMISLQNSAISCCFCSFPCQKNFLYCETCCFSLCETCAIDEKAATKLSGFPVLCKSNHELSFYTASSFFYSRRKGTWRVIRCNACSVRWVGASWSCRLCNFDLCLNCIYRAQRVYNYFCRNNHQLEPCYTSGHFIDCSVCTIRRKSLRGECKLCDYVLCEQCIDYYSRNKFSKDLCPKGHGLVYSDDSSFLYMRCFDNSTIKCNGCNAIITEKKNFHCRPCFFNLCQDCYNTIQTSKQMTKRLQCGLQHDMEYKFNTSQVSRHQVICDKCRERFIFTGTFHCETCKFNLCLKCVHCLLVS